ncbi:hypothetical protein PanWU01x14_122370 [Parasponia andersonii]|uniref:Uncharacterized protein n=1 Tax=Parasponia andersonii TaxID=3476 RepID=A0A2P5CUN4_PARAD|nr:hypothetical protein PanWU01x14_122370 [Parasponia andersonii]
MEDMREDDNPIFPVQFREKMDSESVADIIEKGIQAAVGIGDHKEQEMENKDANDDEFVTHEKRGEKAQGERIPATE